MSVLGLMLLLHYRFVRAWQWVLALEGPTADCAVKAAAAAIGCVTVAAAAVVSGFCGDFTPVANEMDACFRFNEVDVVFNVEEAEHP
jgi:hypothetical protein